MKNPNDPIGNRNLDLPDSSAVPQPPAPLRAPSLTSVFGVIRDLDICLWFLPVTVTSFLGLT